MITDSAEQLQWLVDRAQISDLLIEFARALDEGWRIAVVRVHVVWRSGTGPAAGRGGRTEATA